MVRYYLKGKEITKDKAEKIIKSDTIKGYKKHKPVISIHDYFQTIDNKGLPIGRHDLPGRQTGQPVRLTGPNLKLMLNFINLPLQKTFITEILDGENEIYYSPDYEMTEIYETK